MIRKFFAEEAAKLREMNFTDKRQYIWEYYKLHMFFAALILFIGGSLINVWFINPPKRDYFYIAWQGGHIDARVLENLEDRLNIIVDEEIQGRYRATVRSYVLSGEPTFDQALVTRFHALISVGAIHTTITSYAGVEEAAVHGLLLPVDYVMAEIAALDPVMYRVISDNVLHMTFTMEDGTEVTAAIAINLRYAPLLTELGFNTDDLYIGVITTSTNHYQTAKGLLVMFAEGSS